MNKANNTWPVITNKLASKNGTELLLVGVHPTYGRGIVSEERFQHYRDAFINVWQSGENNSRILISGLVDEGFVAWCGGEYERIATFPDVINKSGTTFDMALVFGSTAQTENETKPGCVNLVSIALLDKGYAKKVRIIEEGTLFPGRKS